MEPPSIAVSVPLPAKAMAMPAMPSTAGSPYRTAVVLENIDSMIVPWRGGTIGTNAQGSAQQVPHVSVVGREIATKAAAGIAGSQGCGGPGAASAPKTSSRSLAHEPGLALDENLGDCAGDDLANAMVTA